MFHMLCCFDLKPGFQLEEFREAFADFTLHLQDQNLVETSSPIGIRQSDTILDTDTERAHQYFSIMSFRDRIQADAAVEFIPTAPDIDPFDGVKSVHSGRHGAPRDAGRIGQAP